MRPHFTGSFARAALMAWRLSAREIGLQLKEQNVVQHVIEIWEDER